MTTKANFRDVHDLLLTALDGCPLRTEVGTDAIRALAEIAQETPLLHSRVAELEKHIHFEAEQHRQNVLDMDAARAERDALRAQVDEAASVLTDTLTRGEGEAVESLARRTLAAMSTPREAKSPAPPDDASMGGPKMSNGHKDAERQRMEARLWREALKRAEDGQGQHRAAHDAWGSDPIGGAVSWVLHGDKAKENP